MRDRSQNSRSYAILLSGALAVSLAACAEPDADRAIEQAALTTNGAKPQIQGAQGPLSMEQSHALLAKLGGGSDDAILKRHVAIEEAVAGSPLTADNQVTVLPNGTSAFKAMAEAIRGAKHNLNLEYYTIEDVDLDGDGTKLSDLLLEKRRQGVAVNIIYDSYGSSDTPGEFFGRLKKAGVNFLDFHPISPTQAFNINDRDHRKILVADGEIGIVGGVNLSKSYESKFPGSGSSGGSGSGSQEKATPPVEGLTNALGLTTKLPDKWRDTAARIEGPAVAELQKLFVAQWESEKGPPLDKSGFFPKLAAKGDQVARIIGSTPDQSISRYYVTVVSALRNAEKRIWISAAYFVPTSEEMKALTDAAQRGVDVRLLLPDVSDSKEAIEVAHSHYTDLLEAGVKIYETKDVVLHSKTVVIDGVWSAIGSSNFDHRSVLFNDEVDVIVLGPETANALEEDFADGEKIATAIDRQRWEDQRPVTERMRGFFARMWESLL
jgi:cardiolipin synthase